MAITQAMCTSFKKELLEAEHDFGVDTFKIALYTSAASMDANTTVYSTTNEVSGTGYSAGGKALTVATGTPSLGGTTAFVSFNNISWASSAITARGALIYNSSKANKAVVVIDFGSDITSSGSTFNVNFPSADSLNAVIRIS